jgi:acetyl-CoA acetyltransferase
MSGLSAIAGLGFSELSRQPIGSIRELAVAATRAAAKDGGFALDEIDGLILTQSALAPANALPLKIQDDLGLRELRLLTVLEAKGSSAIQTLQYATLAVRGGMAKTVACVFADTPLMQGKGGGQAFAIESPVTGIEGWEHQYGLFGATGTYALTARRYMHMHGATEKHLGAVALNGRRWAELNPRAFLRKPLTMADYLASPYIVEPFRMLDCAYPVNGAIAVIVTSAERAADGAKPPVYIHGMGQGHSETGGVLAGKTAFAMAGIGPADVSMAQFYDAFSFSTLAALEDYGLCGPGEAGPFVLDGHTLPGARLPVNTSGGHLSGYYLQGMTPISEAVIQARGEGGARQSDRNQVILVNGSGGRLEYHAALIVSPLPTLAGRR